MLVFVQEKKILVANHVRMTLRHYLYENCFVVMTHTNYQSLKYFPRLQASICYPQVSMNTVIDVHEVSMLNFIELKYDMFYQFHGKYIDGNFFK